MRSGFSSNEGLDIVITAVVYLGTLVIALYFREVARSRVAAATGDPIPRMAGRSSPTLRSLADPLGTVFFPLFTAVTGATSYAWAKPLSYDIGHPGERRPVLVGALAGPVTNLVLATLAARVLAPMTQSVLAARVLGLFILANLTMAVMHLLPIPPLDGSRILATFLSPQGRASFQRLEPWGIAILFLIAFLGRAILQNEPFVSIITSLGRLIA